MSYTLILANHLIVVQQKKQQSCAPIELSSSLGECQLCVSWAAFEAIQVVAFFGPSIKGALFNREYNHYYSCPTKMSQLRDIRSKPSAPFFSLYFQEELRNIFNSLDSPQNIREVASTQQPHQMHKPTHLFRIKRRKISHNFDRRKLRRVANIPKSLITNFYKYLQKYEDEYKDLYSQDHHLLTVETLKNWLSNRFDISLEHLSILFGHDSLQCYQNRKVLSKMIREHLWEMTGLKTKVQNNVTYMVCLQKYASRLCNPQLASRIQM